MKSKLSIILSLLIISAVYNAGETIVNKNENLQHQHTFLVKTDLTKEQVEILLNQYHQNLNQVETTSLKHKNSTDREGKAEFHVNEVKPEATQLRAKKEKKYKEEKEIPEAPEAPEVGNSTETTSLKKKGKKEKSRKQEAPEVPEAPESPESSKVENITETTSLKKKDKNEKNKNQEEAPKSSETPESPEAENITETVSFKKKGKKEKNKKQETPEVPEVKEIENKTNLLANGTSVEEEGDTETEIETESESEIDTIILTNKKISKQKGSKVFGYFFTILLTIAFVSLIIYATQPKKNKKYFNNNHYELTDYLLVKEN